MTTADLKILSRILRDLGHGDPRCGWVGPSAVRVFCPSCQPDGEGEPHLIVAIADGQLDVSHP
jgi:hypothetical protein